MLVRMSAAAAMMGFIAACASAPSNGQTTAPVPTSPAAIGAHIRTLSHDEFEGRAPGTRGEQRAIDYIVHQFQSLGLSPGPTGWTQDFSLLSLATGNAPSLRVSAPSGETQYVYSRDEVIWSRQNTPAIVVDNAELVFVGFGVEAPERGWSDYANLDLRGKVVVMLVNDPDFETPPDHPTSGAFGGRAMTWYGRWQYKFDEAARQGALGALIVHETAAAGYGFDVVASTFTLPQFDLLRDDGGASHLAFEGWLTTAAAEDLFTRAGHNLAELKARAQERGFAAVPLGLRLSTRIQQTAEVVQTHNAVAMLPGAEHPDEVIIYSAHHDHLGMCAPVDGDSICNGAVDNAAGVALLLEIARAQVQAGRTSRSIAFVTFTAEEKGHLGSAYYREHPLFDPALTVAAINMDTASTYGPARNVTLVGGGRNDLDGYLERAARAQARYVSAEPFPEAGTFFRSDHLNLARLGIPVLYTGSGLDLIEGGRERGEALARDYVAHRYHKPSDEYRPDWDLRAAAQDANLLFSIGREIADSAAWPAWRPSSEFSRARTRTEQNRETSGVHPR